MKQCSLFDYLNDDLAVLCGCCRAPVTVKESVIYDIYT